MAAGSELPGLGGYPFEVRYSNGTLERAKVAADMAADAYIYFSGLFGEVKPDIAILVTDKQDWPESNNPYGMPFFRNEPGELRPGILVMPAGAGDFWATMVEDLRDASPTAYPRLLETYADETGGLDLQPFFDLITIHELGHAFEVLGDLRFPTLWLSEVFVNLALHTFIATQLPQRLEILEVLPTVGTESQGLSNHVRATGYSTLDEADAHYPGWSDEPMSTLNYVWFQYRWQRLAAEIFNADGESALVRFWNCFHGTDHTINHRVPAASLVPLLTTDVSITLGHAVRDWQ